MKQCVTCLQLKDETEFNWRYRSLGIRHKTCRECHKGHRDRWYENHKEAELERVRTRKHSKRDEAREYVLDYPSTHPCQDCGESDPRVLEFHHVGDKEKTISRMVTDGYNIETINAELQKCTVLCANCHRKKTMAELGWFRGRK